MPLINLIESDLIVARKAAQRKRVSQMALAGSCAVIGVGYAALLGQSANLGAEEADIQSKIKKLKPMLRAIEEDRRIIADLEPRLEALTDARDLTNRWGRIMQHLTVNTPQDCYLTAVRADAGNPNEAISVTFTGVGKTQSDASQFLLRCQNAKDMQGVNLVQSRERTVLRGSMIEFEIKGSIVGTEPPKAPAEGGAKS